MEAEAEADRVEAEALKASASAFTSSLLSSGMTNCIKCWDLINFILVFFPNLYNKFYNSYNTIWYNIKNNKEDNQESKTNIKENLIIWIKKRRAFKKLKTE